jgi:glutathione S-transferase
MRTLHHLALSPFSRKVRVALREKGLEFQLRIEKVWERRPEFLALNAAGTVPVLVEDDGTAIADSGVICEYLEEVYPGERNLLGEAPAERAEVRRLVAWFDQKFAREVTDNLYREKMMRKFLGLGEPNSAAIRAGVANIHYHLDYIGWLTERRKFLAGDKYSLADVSAAAHLSALDYIGDVPWDQHAKAKDWYARIKSRPAFRPLLADLIAGAPPPKHYADLDF